MAHDFTICVGTVGAGVWFSPDGGDHWRRSRMKLPFYAEPGEIQIRALAVSPHNPHHLLAGSEAGLYRSEDNGANWDAVGSPMEGKQIWSATSIPPIPIPTWPAPRSPESIAPSIAARAGRSSRCRWPSDAWPARPRSPTC